MLLAEHRRLAALDVVCRLPRAEVTCAALAANVNHAALSVIMAVRGCLPALVNEGG